jgi:hypothetical protein
MKKTTKENPITTFRKNFEARSKTVMSSLKKAQDGIAVNDDMINKAGSTGGYKKPSPFSRPDANLEAEGIDKIDRLNQMYPNYKFDPLGGKMLYPRDPKINPPPTRVKAKGGPVKYKTGGAAKATKFAALAKPFNKATAADRIAGAKKNASKKK